MAPRIATALAGTMASSYVHGYDENAPAPGFRTRRGPPGGSASTRIPLSRRRHGAEAGCGTGAQTVTLASNSPGARITSIDVSALHLGEAGARVKTAQASPTWNSGRRISLPSPCRRGILR